MAAKSKTDAWGVVLFAAFLIGLALLVVAAVAALTKTDGWDHLIVPIVIIGAVCVVGPAAAMAVIEAIGDGAANAETIELLRSINERLLLTEVAKHARNRQQDRDAVRQAIRDEIRRKDFEAALVMVDQLSKAFGYVREAEDFRDEITVARQAETEQQILKAITGLERMLTRHEWEQAAREAAKIHRLYPDSHRTSGLVKHVRDAREDYKLDLERRFLEANDRDDVETAMELLKELDAYLTEAEAEPLREMARGVIGKKRQNLGVQFKLAVHDKEWTESVRIGEQIIREFPNSKMAGEVRTRLDLLRARAAGEQAARSPAPAAAPAPTPQRSAT